MCNDLSITTRADNTKRLSEAKLCEIVGVSQQYRQSLVRRRLVDQAARGGCTRTDAIELAAIARLADHLSPNEMALAWNQLRDSLRATLPGGRLDVVFDRALGLATLVRTDAELRSGVISGRAVQVVELGARLQEVIDAFNRWASAGTARTNRPAQQRRQPRSA